MRIQSCLLSGFVVLFFHGSAGAEENKPLVENGNVVPLTRFLEQRPLDKDAPFIRSALLDWEAKSKDVVDVVCPGVFSPLPDKSIKYNNELLAQFIFGSAAYQIANPLDKGELMPAQLAGMRSMLMAYRSIVAQEPAARVPRFDELSQDEAQGSLSQVLEQLVVANCKPAPLAAANESGSGLPPWHFQMTPQEVTAFSDYGPYKSFKNGDLETYSGLFNGQKYNVQFFFDEGKLTRIGIFLYEGQDIKAATRIWWQSYAMLKSQFGKLDLQGMQTSVPDNPSTFDALTSAAAATVQAGGRVKLIPIRQPKDKVIFVDFSGLAVRGQVFYDVTIFYDAPH